MKEKEESKGGEAITFLKIIIITRAKILTVSKPTQVSMITYLCLVILTDKYRSLHQLIKDQA
jgi:hypothetical protein